MKFSHLSLFILACGAAPVASYAGFDIGINIGGPEVVVRSQPPPERYEAIGVAPGPGYVFIRGAIGRGAMTGGNGWADAGKCRHSRAASGYRASGSLAAAAGYG